MNHKYDLYVLVDHLPNWKPPVKVALTRFTRPAPSCLKSVKHLRWFRESKDLRQKFGPELNDVVMYEPNGNITEGIQSNFHVIKNNKIITAPLDEVIPGAIQDLVIKCTEELDIKIQYDFPRISEVNTWEGAFLTSTSRCVLPISGIVLSDGSHVEIPHSSMIDHLITTVDNEIVTAAVKIEELGDYSSCAY